jgi:hypothetical protein
LWMGSTSGPGSVVRMVNASPAPSGIGRQRPAKQNQSSPAFVNFHFDFGDFAPVNSKKCDAGMTQRRFREVTPLGAEIDNRRSFRPRRREAPAQLHQLDAVFAAAERRARSRSARCRRAARGWGPLSGIPRGRGSG